MCYICKRKFYCPLLPPANEVWGKVTCLQACVCPEGGAWSQEGVLALGGAWSQGGCLVLGRGAWSWGEVLAPGGLPGLGGACSQGGACFWGVPASGGCLLPGGACSWGSAWWRSPPQWLLLLAVCILLECILGWQ